jgi:hypothetical protein
MHRPDRGAGNLSHSYRGRRNLPGDRHLQSSESGEGQRDTVIHGWWREESSEGKAQRDWIKGADRDADGYSHQHRDSDRHRDGHSHRNSNSDCHCDRHRNADYDINSNGDGHARNAHRDRNRDARDSNRHADRDRNSDRDSHGRNSNRNSN